MKIGDAKKKERYVKYGGMKVDKRDKRKRQRRVRRKEGRKEGEEIKEWLRRIRREKKGSEKFEVITDKQIDHRKKK